MDPHQGENAAKENAVDKVCLGSHNDEIDDIPAHAGHLSEFFRLFTQDLLNPA